MPNSVKQQFDTRLEFIIYVFHHSLFEYDRSYHSGYLDEEYLIWKDPKIETIYNADETLKTFLKNLLENASTSGLVGIGIQLLPQVINHKLGFTKTVEYDREEYHITEYGDRILISEFLTEELISELQKLEELSSLSLENVDSKMRFELSMYEINQLSIFDSLQSQWCDAFELPIFDKLEKILFDGLEKVKAKHRITEEPLFITNDGIFHIGEEAEKGLFEKEFFRIELNEDDMSELSRDSAISFVHEPILDVLHSKQPINSCAYRPRINLSNSVS